MHRLLAPLFLLTPLTALASQDVYEVCTFEGPCAIRAYDQAAGEHVWLANSEGIDLQTIWDGTWLLVDGELYGKLSAEIGENSRFVVPAIQPTTGAEMRKGGGKPTPPAPTPPAGGSLITVGNITVGGGNTCAPCHGSDLKEIHSKVKDKKN